MPASQGRFELAVELYINKVYIEGIHNYRWKQALEDAGYSLNYIKSYCGELWGKAKKQIDKAKLKISIKAAWELEKVDEEYRSLYVECREVSDRTNAKAILDSLARRQAGFTDKYQDSNKADQPVLTAAEKERYKMLAKHMTKVKEA